MKYPDYSYFSTKTLRNLFQLHLEMARECPEFVTEYDHAERHAIALELDRRCEEGTG